MLKISAMVLFCNILLELPLYIQQSWTVIITLVATNSVFRVFRCTFIYSKAQAITYS